MSIFREPPRERTRACRDTLRKEAEGKPPGYFTCAWCRRDTREEVVHNCPKDPRQAGSSPERHDEAELLRPSEACEHEPLLDKIRQSQRRCGTEDDTTTAWAVGGLRRLADPVPHLSWTEVRITWSRMWEASGYSAHEIPRRDPSGELHVYLDACLGLVLYHREKPVLTLGVSVAPRGLLVAQVQLRERRGNRFLYDLPVHYLDWALDVLGGAFGKDRLWLVVGGSAVRSIEESYGRKMPWRPAPGTRERIAALYDRELAAYDREDETYDTAGRFFVRLRPRVGVEERCA